MLRVYQYPKCSTCRNALRWLDAHDVEYESIDITLAPPSSQLLKRALATTGLPITKLFNTSGQAYRDGNYRERLRSMSEAEALAALAGDGKLIKRPLVLGENVALVGFDAAAYEGHLDRLHRG